jgi:hypothetical protein
MGFSDKRLAYLALQSANLQPGTRRATASGRGLIHEAVKAMRSRGTTTSGEGDRDFRAAVCCAGCSRAYVERAVQLY